MMISEPLYHTPEMLWEASSKERSIDFWPLLLLAVMAVLLLAIGNVVLFAALFFVFAFYFKPHRIRPVHPSQSIF